MLVQCSPLLCYCILTEELSPARTHKSGKIGCRLDADFPACPFDRSRSYDQLLMDRELFTQAECQPVSTVQADFGQYLPHMYPALILKWQIDNSLS